MIDYMNSLFPNEDILTKEEIESWRSFVDCCIITCLISSLELSQRGNMWPQYVNPEVRAAT